VCGSQRALSRVKKTGSPSLSGRGRLYLAFSRTPQLGRRRDERHAEDIADGEDPVGATIRSKNLGHGGNVARSTYAQAGRIAPRQMN
jgi:hypothetical protein